MIKRQLFHTLYFVETEYTKWTKDLEIEYSFESILLVTKPFQTTEIWENLTRLQNSIKNDVTLEYKNLNYKKFWSSICSIVFVL